MKSRPPRLFVESPLKAGVVVQLTAAQAHYLGTVMRAGAGGGVALFNGRDGEWSAVIESMGKKTGRLRLSAQTRNQEPESGVWLVFAPLRKAACRFIAEKATELGAARLIPVLTARTHVRGINTERLRATVVEAAEQCGRLTLPPIAPAAALADLPGQWPATRELLFLDESGKGAPIAEVLASMKKTKGKAVPLAVLSGPEGGFSAAELDWLRKLPFSTAAGLGKRILRAETAAIAALACCQALVGDWT
ncbi:MAG TPA: 16S rRNA (uracil(1498)-N(3))-methyltransferase [Alphaproteobacteria bacterium]|nr:16S rRNA (uracil(1498)-N(3))-methyltransferase [Alphaproteobacteria bacterium]